MINKVIWKLYKAKEESVTKYLDVIWYVSYKSFFEFLVGGSRVSGLQATPILLEAFGKGDGMGSFNQNIYA